MPVLFGLTYKSQKIYIKKYRFSRKLKKFKNLLAVAILAEKKANILQYPAGSPVKCRLRNEHKSSILMMCHYPDLGSDSDWSCCKRNLLQPIRSTTRIWVVTHHQYESLHSFLRWHFTGTPMVAPHIFLGYLARRKQKDLEFTEKCFWNFVTPRNKGTHNYIRLRRIKQNVMVINGPKKKTLNYYVETYCKISLCVMAIACL